MLNISNYSPKGTNKNTQVITDERGTRYLSYNTVIAFEYEGKTYLSNKKWSVTTSRHAKYVKDYAGFCVPTPHEKFIEMYKKAFNDTYQDNY